MSGRERGDDRYEALEPGYQVMAARLRDVRCGSVREVDGTAMVRHSRSISAAPDEVWSVLASTARVSTWLGQVVAGAFDGLGSVADVLLDGDVGDPGPQSVRCTVTTWEPPRRLVVDWEHVGEPVSQLELTLNDDGGSTVLELQHRGVAAGRDYVDGWHAHLDVLAAVAENRPSPSWTEAFVAARALDVSVRP